MLQIPAELVGNVENVLAVCDASRSSTKVFPVHLRWGGTCFWIDFTFWLFCYVPYVQFLFLSVILSRLWKMQLHLS